jgi:nucleotide-binding universal stress UspA family protein
VFHVGKFTIKFEEDTKKAKVAGLKAEPVILKGDPAEKILDFTDEHDIDMIVIGSLGKRESSVSRPKITRF